MQRHGLPHAPEDLVDLPVLQLSVMSQFDFIELHPPGEPPQRVRVSSCVSGNSALALTSAPTFAIFALAHPWRRW